MSTDRTDASDVGPTPVDADRREPTSPSSAADSTGELLVPLVASDTGPARAWAEATGVDRVAPPDELPEGTTHLDLTRTFCFADLSAFTASTRERGPHQAVRRLDELRRVTRNVAARRGVRVTEWPGDGVMLVGADPAATIALGAHLVHQFSDGPPAVCDEADVPEWVSHGNDVSVEIRGVGAIGGVERLKVGLDPSDR